jgi:hypothetical protein
MMPTTRRALLKLMAATGVAHTIHSSWSPSLHAQDADDALVSRMRADLTRHAAFGDKFSAGPGDLATADWIAARLRASGDAVDTPTFAAPYFVKRATRLAAGDVTVEVMAQAPVTVTGPAGITAPLGLVDGAAGGDVNGRIAVIVFPNARHAALFAERGVGQTVTAAARAGAKAIVMVTTGPTGEAIALNCPEDGLVHVPAVVLAPTQAAAIVEAARRGVEATLVVDGDATHKPSPNVIGRVTRGDRWIAISTPRSGWFGCVGERGTGTALFLELADWAPKRFPNHSVFVMNTGGHEYFFAGSHRAVMQAPPPPATAVWVHVGATVAVRDSQERNGVLTMLDTADPQRSLMVTETARAAATDAFRGLSGLATPTPIRAGAGELSAFTDRGYTTAFAVIGTHRQFHTVQDTLACVDARLIVPVLRAHQRTMEVVVL